MSDEQAFLNALAANPADDTTRLVYADWLDEHGEPAKAEYLRLVVGLIPHFETGKPDPPEVGRVAALSEVIPLDWRLTATARFAVVLYGVVPARKIQAIKLVRELTGQGLREAKDFVETVPARFPVRTNLEGAIGLRGRLSQSGMLAAVHPADLSDLPGLATYEILAELYPYQMGEDSWYELSTAAQESFRRFLATALRVSEDTAAPLAVTGAPVVIATRLEASRAEKKLAELRSLLPPPGDNPEWGIVLYSHYQLQLTEPPT